MTALGASGGGVVAKGFHAGAKEVRAIKQVGVLFLLLVFCPVVWAQEGVLPFAETFETVPTSMAGIVGNLHGQHGWTADGGAQVQSHTACSGEQGLALSEASASQTFSTNPATVRIEFSIYYRKSTMAPDSIDPDALAGFYINTNSQIVVYSNAVPVTLSAEVSNGWNKIEVFCDTVSKVWNLTLNDTLVADNLAFHSEQTSFSAVRFNEPSTNTPTYLDEIHITAESSGAADSDGDGLPDEWEQRYYGGSTNVTPGAMASNGVNTVLEAYIAGLDPTDPDTLFELTDLSLNSPCVMSWNGETDGRRYTIYWASNLLDGFTVLQSNFTGGAYTDSTHTAEEKGFYKIEVELE